MSVRPILLSNGAIRGTPGAYRTSPPPMAGKYAGSSLREDVTYYTVDETGTAVLKTVKAYPFYCDSVSGGLNTSGDGSLENPFRSINQALLVLQPILTCLNSSSCCTYLVLRVKGTVDYTINYSSGLEFIGYNRFIMEPWDSDFITISIPNNIGGYSINRMSRCILKKIEFYCVGTFSDWVRPSLIFNTVNGILNSCNTHQEYNSYYYGFEGFSMSSGILYDCNVNISITKQANLAFCFAGGRLGLLYNCNAKIICVGNTPIFGFYLWRDSSFFNCSGEVIGPDSITEGCGFYGNTNSLFLNCTGNSLNRTDCDI